MWHKQNEQKIEKLQLITFAIKASASSTGTNASSAIAVEKLLANAELGEAKSSSALEKFKITIIPLMNPDGSFRAVVVVVIDAALTLDLCRLYLHATRPDVAQEHRCA